jgi:septal ring factor EnvC (AmiA/AmiB activator)
MSEIEQFESRIVAAMQRIGGAVDRLAEQAATPPLEPETDPEELAALRTQLEEERTANAQLEARVQAIRDRQETRVAALQSEVEEQKRAVARLDTELQGLRRVARQLRENNAALRQANEQGVGDPDLIDAAMRAEVEGLRAERATETAEVAAILAVLGPLAEQALSGDDAAEEQDAG